MSASSLLFESIQQSPIDPVMFDEQTDDGDLSSRKLFCVAEEQPLDPPIETPLIDPYFSVPVPIVIDSRPWIHQLDPKGLIHRNVKLVPLEKNQISVTRIHFQSLEESIIIAANGLFIEFQGSLFPLSDVPEHTQNIPLPALKLLYETHAAIAHWRSRVVRLTMDTDEFECSLMDDICPPRTFLVEFKKSVILKSVKIQAGIAYWETATGRTVSVPSSVLDQEPDVSKFLHRIAPELVLTDPAQVWQDVIHLRAMCLEEDHRIAFQQLNPDHAAVSGG